MSILYTGTALEPTTKSKGYVYPANNYAGTIRFDRIDESILWAQAEEAKGDDSHWFQGAWIKPMHTIGRNHADAPFEPTSNDDTGIEECGTAFCLAGRAAVHAGYKPVMVQQRDGGWYNSYASMRSVIDPEVVSDAESIAKNWFGCPKSNEYGDYDERVGHIRSFFTRLFDSSNKVADLKRLRDDLANSVGFPTRWRAPLTPMINHVDNLADGIDAQSNVLDSLHEMGLLDLKGKTPDEVLADLFDIDLAQLESEHEQVAAWHEAV